MNAANQADKENIWKVYTSTFMRYFQKRVILGTAHYNMIPWFDSFEMKNINEDLCNMFNITGYISDTEAVPGSEWETILNTMKEHG